MSIKVTLGEVKPRVKEKPFPKLMRAIYPTSLNEVIALFAEEKKGVVIYANKKSGFLVERIGKEITDKWDFKTTPFTDFNEPITLQND